MKNFYVSFLNDLGVCVTLKGGGGMRGPWKEILGQRQTISLKGRCPERRVGVKVEAEVIREEQEVFWVLAVWSRGGWL